MATFPLITTFSKTRVELWQKIPPPLSLDKFPEMVRTIESVYLFEGDRHGEFKDDTVVISIEEAQGGLLIGYRLFIHIIISDSPRFH